MILFVHAADIVLTIFQVVAELIMVIVNTLTHDSEGLNATRYAIRKIRFGLSPAGKQVLRGFLDAGSRQREVRGAPEAIAELEDRLILMKSRPDSAPQLYEMEEDVWEWLQKHPKSVKVRN